MEINIMTRTRHCSLSASSPALTMWRRLPAFAGAVRLEGGLGYTPGVVVEADAAPTAPGQPAWSPPI